MTIATPRTEVAIVGAGPAGSIAAALLAQAGHEVTVFERSPAYRWRACGVFSWTAMRQLDEIGLSRDEISRVARPIGRLRLLASEGSEVMFAAPEAAGLDRSTLDPLLVRRARDAGATVCEATAVRAVRLSGPRASLEVRDGSGTTEVQADVVIGADGIRSTVAAAAGVLRRPLIRRRAGITFHVAERAAATETVIALFARGYCGIAPVPGGRLNVGIVLDPEALRSAGAAATARHVLQGVLDRDDRAAATVRDLEPLDRVEGAVPLAHAVTRVAGDRWLLAGDAAGFLDPFSGEGIGRAITTAMLAADAVHRRLRGDRRAFDAYAAAYRQTYRDRDRLTLLLQQFLGRPALLSYAVRRAATRPRIRARLEGVLTEALPAASALDPRFLAALLRP